MTTLKGNQRVERKERVNLQQKAGWVSGESWAAKKRAHLMSSLIWTLLSSCGFWRLPASSLFILRSVERPVGMINQQKHPAYVSVMRSNAEWYKLSLKKLYFILLLKPQQESFLVSGSFV